MLKSDSLAECWWPAEWWSLAKLWNSAEWGTGSPAEWWWSAGWWWPAERWSLALLSRPGGLVVASSMADAPP